MSAGDQERDLRAALDQAHGDEAPPSFARTWRAAEARRHTPATRHLPTLRWLLAPAGAVAALALTIGICVGQPEGGESPSLTSLAYSGSDWSAPTDFLLETPGTGWLSSTPSFGVEVNLDVDLDVNLAQEPERSTP